jgi:predicted kinase
VATLFLTCGVQGSGKTTLARHLEKQHRALRLTADEWLHELHPGSSQAELDARRAGVERLQWRTASRCLELGCNVVLDWGSWTREERDHSRAQASLSRSSWNFGTTVMSLEIGDSSASGLR